MLSSVWTLGVFKFFSSVSSAESGEWMEAPLGRLGNRYFDPGFDTGE